jgi:hypothetical protein
MLRAVSEARQSGAPEPPTWTARLRWSDDRHATAYARNHTFPIGQPVSFHTTDAHPSAVEYLLGALGGDLLSGFARAAARRAVPLDALEASVSGRLNNPLIALGVIGETGHPGFEEIAATLYVSAEADEPTLQGIWQATLAASPLVHTLQRCLALHLEIKIIP